MVSYLSSVFISHRAHIFFFATLSLIAGIIVAFVALPLWITGMVALAFIIPFVFVCLHSVHVDYKWFFLPMSFVTGAFLYQHQFTQHLAFQEKYNNIPLTIIGTVACIEKIQNARHRWHIIIDLEKIYTTNNHAVVNESVAIYSVHNPKVSVGDNVRLSNIIFKKVENSDYNLYLAKEKISATTFIDIPKIECLEHPQWNINRFVAQLRNNLFNSLQRTTNKETFALFSSIFLGNRTAVKQQMDYAKEPFKNWGISHYLARSGLHLVIFGLVWHFILGFLPLMFFGKQLFLLLLVICYTLLSWSSVSFNRALIMFLIAKFCLLSKTRLHYIHLICLATSMVLICNPLQLFYLDFQLSFGLTFALAWFTHIQHHKKQVS